MATDENMVSMSLHHPTGHNTHIVLAHKLHTHSGSRVGALQIIDELCQVLNRVDVMVGGWGDETHSWG